jgi:hypothetical protein
MEKNLKKTDITHFQEFVENILEILGSQCFERDSNQSQSLYDSRMVPLEQHSW